MVRGDLLVHQDRQAADRELDLGLPDDVVATAVRQPYADQVGSHLEVAQDPSRNRFQSA
jgi:hypothetical protein